MPEPLGKDLDVRMFCDSDHTGEKRARHSRTGFLIFCNMALIDWVSKKQATIETSVVGAEFVAMKHGIEKLRGLVATSVFHVEIPRRMTGMFLGPPL